MSRVGNQALSCMSVTLDWRCGSFAHWSGEASGSLARGRGVGGSSPATGGEKVKIPLASGWRLVYIVELAINHLIKGPMLMYPAPSPPAPAPVMR